MERFRVLFFLSILLAAALVLAAGCTGTGPVQTPPVSTASPSPNPSPSPANTIPVATPSPVTPAPTATAAPITSDDVTQHFMDLAFGSGNTRLNRLAYNPTTQVPKNSLSVFNGNSDDTALIQSFISQFNDLSATNQFSTNIKTSTTADIVLEFIPATGMDAIPQESYSKEIKSGGVTYAKIGPQIIYINDDLTGDVRGHIVLRSLLYALGFRGETLKYPDSVFYYQSNTNTGLSLIDQKAIEIMYGTGLYPDMTVANVKNVVYVKTN